MNLRVRLFAGLRERAGRDELALDGLPEGLTVGALKRELEARYPALGSLAHVAGVVGTQYANDATRLSAADEVSLLPPVSGGAPSADELLARGVFELAQAPLELAALQARVGHPSCGAIASFLGTTRDTHQGRRVLRLEYEAFEAMTGPEMERIFARCRATVATAPERALRMLVIHRVGVVEIGQPSVAIVVASPHRDAAFVACRFLIDELKQSLPIWKKEVYADGAAWIGERS